jgi:membrane protein required for colicin V production
MNWLDIVLLIIVAASVITSFRKGLSREVIGLASVVIALVAGTWFYGTVGSFFAPYTSSRALANFAGFFVVFCVVALLGSLVSFAAGKFLKVTGLSFFDHLLGAGFGVVRAAVIGVALVMGIMAFSPGPKAPDVVVHSRLAPYAAAGARVFAAMAPNELKEGFRKTYAQVRSAWGKAIEKGTQKEHERKI